VFSFGVVLLELITGHKAINPADPEESLVEWVQNFNFNLRNGEFSFGIVLIIVRLTRNEYFIFYSFGIFSD
jgi:hypothetical protein